MRDASQLTKSEIRYIRGRYQNGDAPDNIARDFDISATDVTNICFDVEMEHEARAVQKRSISNVQLSIQDAKLESIAYTKKYMRKFNEYQKEIFDKLGPVLSKSLTSFVEAVGSGEKVLTLQEMTTLWALLEKVGSPDLGMLKLFLKAKEIEQNALAIKKSTSGSVFDGPIRVIPAKTEDSEE